MNTIFERTDRTVDFGFSNVLETLSGNAIARYMFFTRGFYLEMEIRITFLYEKQFQKMTLFSKELIELYNWASATLYKSCATIQSFQPHVFSERTFLENRN